ncbi:hypothetical protein HY490_03565 [Candidatus Woesearchaeota archaeon]|nr:hypothetical protein [Candidatus Woesearchaeota archaeon]
MQDKDVSTAIDEQRGKVKALREQLRQLDSVYSEHERQRTALGKHIATLLNQTKHLRAERNMLTAQVKEKKDQRQKLNDDIRQKVMYIKQLNEQKKNVEHTAGESPGRLRQQIEILDTKIQTEALPFEKEKELMKKIKEFKKKLDHAVKGSHVWEEAHTLSKEIDQLKEKADTLHRDIQQQAEESQRKHESILESSKKIDELKKNEQELDTKLDNLKKQLDTAGGNLQTELSKLSELTGEQEEMNKQELKRLKDAEHKAISERKKDVEDKLKRGEKLTTQDLLVMQG